MDELLLINQIELLLNERQFGKAKKIIYERLAKGIDIQDNDGATLKSRLAGFLIDIGEDSNDEDAVKEGLNIFESERTQLCQFITEDSIEYNLGNAYNALFKIQRLQSNFKFKPETIQILTKAKNHYWKAYKISQDDSDLQLCLLTNLANALMQSGRVIEALQYYDRVLKKYPSFPNAHASRSECLVWLNELSYKYSVNLIYQAVKGFEIASESSDPSISKWQKEVCFRYKIDLANKFNNLGYTEESFKHDDVETHKEADSHSAFRKFCIEKYLCLSEHSIYCNCIAAAKDDLVIPLSSKTIGGFFVSHMELLLNRLKSEFSLARSLFYQSQTYLDEYFKVFDDEIVYTELFENEAIGMRFESLRTSFRMCFGILDKIAKGICELFNLPVSSRENIYFENFWNNKNTKEGKERWGKINSIENFPLLALYSQANDLNIKNGEWGFFKDWRNMLEHGLLFLTHRKNNLDPYGLFKNNENSKRILYDEFKIKTLHLLQLTRSAIFNFVFCVRHEGVKFCENKDVKPSIILKPKQL
jgi:tetratricopeptide (TPR) repeat protein